MANNNRERAILIVKRLPQPFLYDQFAAELNLSPASCRQTMTNMLAAGWVVHEGVETEQVFCDHPNWNRNNRAMYVTRFVDTPFYRFVRQLLPKLPSPFNASHVCTMGAIPPWGVERVRFVMSRMFEEDLIHPMVETQWVTFTRGRPAKMWTAKIEEILRQKDLQAELDRLSATNTPVNP